jgi:hypothetical protein
MGMETELASKAYRARCSFCRKDQGAVKKLISGPGVYICDECVGLCVPIIAKEGLAGDPDVVRHLRSRESQYLLEQVKSIEPVYQDVADHQAVIVDILREREVSWAEIGQTLGVSRQAAWHRFAKSL